MVDPDFETIVQLEPDLVVGTPGPAATRLEEKMGAFGAATWFPAIDSLAAVDAMILGMGQRTGHAADAKQVVARIDEREAAVERAVGAEPAPRVLLVVDVGPVVATGPSVFLAEVLRRAGGQNVLTVGAPWQTLDFEQIASLDPDVIVDVSVANGGGPSRVTAASPGWADVRAAREGHVVPIADVRVLRPGPRIAEGIAVLAHALHPQAAVPSW
jgi:iron complex transport system substrate-binding protein